MVISPAGLRPENDFVCEVQQQGETTDPSSHQRGSPTLTNSLLSDNNENLTMDPRQVSGSKVEWPTNHGS
jgi:hypothetical protein